MSVRCKLRSWDADALFSPGAGDGADCNAFLGSDGCHSGCFHQVDVGRYIAGQRESNATFRGHNRRFPLSLLARDDLRLVKTLRVLVYPEMPKI